MISRSRSESKTRSKSNSKSHIGQGTGTSSSLKQTDTIGNRLWVRLTAYSLKNNVITLGEFKAARLSNQSPFFSSPFQKLCSFCFGGVVWVT